MIPFPLTVTAEEHGQLAWAYGRLTELFPAPPAAAGRVLSRALASIPPSAAGPIAPPATILPEADWICASQAAYATKIMGYKSGKEPGLMKRLLEDGTLSKLEPDGNSFKFVISDPVKHLEVKEKLGAARIKPRKGRKA
jgi:hypothetical protein